MGIFLYRKSVLAALFCLIWLVPSTAAGEHVTVIPDFRIDSMNR